MKLPAPMFFREIEEKVKKYDEKCFKLVGVVEDGVLKVRKVCD